MDGCKVFGPFCIAGALMGALLLSNLSASSELISYHIGRYEFSIGYQDLIIAALMIAFAWMELRSILNNVNLKKSTLWFGGLLGGFFGGLSGHQGALRSMFLIKSELSKEQFIATGVSIAVIIDITRISIYISRIQTLNYMENLDIILAAILPAFLGAFIGRRLLHKITIDIIHKYVAWMLVLIAIGIGSGLV